MVGGVRAAILLDGASTLQQICEGSPRKPARAKVRNRVPVLPDDPLKWNALAIEDEILEERICPLIRCLLCHSSYF